jgi:hypothetical protein
MRAAKRREKKPTNQGSWRCSDNSFQQAFEVPLLCDREASETLVELCGQQRQTVSGDSAPGRGQQQ